MIKVSFDFDSTLDRKPIQEYAKELLNRDGIEVWVVTSRFGDDELYKKFFKTTTNVDLTNKDLWDVVNELGIPKERVHFTNMDSKWFFFALNDGFLWHLDDDWTENREILNNTKTLGIDSLTSSWNHKCERILNKKLTK